MLPQWTPPTIPEGTPQSTRTELHRSMTPDGTAQVRLVRGTAGTEPAGAGTRITGSYVLVGVQNARGDAPSGNRYKDTPEGREKALARYGELTGCYFPYGMSPLDR